MAKNNAAKGRQGASGAVSERNNINKFRKKRAARKLWLNLGILTLIILVMILVVINWSRIIAPLKDAALDVGKGGFPVDLPGSTDYVLDGLGDNFCLLPLCITDEIPRCFVEGIPQACLSFPAECMKTFGFFLGMGAVTAFCDFREKSSSLFIEVLIH